MIATLTAVLAAEPAPAGGTPAGEIVGAALVASIAVAAVVAIGVAHRRRGWLNPLVKLVETRTGLPGWSTIPVAIAGVSLVTAVWGYYWDVSWHIDRGRDPGAFANPAHWFIIVGLDGIAFAGVLAFFLGDDRSPSAVRLTRRWSVPAGAFLLGACGLVALAGFPLDDLWHRLFGQDVTAWGPTHIQMIGGASLATLGCWALQVEGRRAAGDAITPIGRRLTRSSDIALAGAFLIGLSTLQVEFDFGVPQFRQLEHPVLIALAAGIGLVAARIRVGKGGALAAALFFITLRGLLAIGVGAFDRTVMHFPLYLAEALIVEAVALRIRRDRQLTLGLVAGSLIGTLGFAAEWGWSHIWMKLPWSADILPEAAVLAAVAGTAGGLLGGLAGRALSSDTDRQPSFRSARVVVWGGAVAALAIALPMSAHRNWTADLRVDQAGANADGVETAFVEVTLDPADAAEGAAWFHVLYWQGAPEGDGGSAIVDLVRRPDGSYRTEAPVPISGPGKTLLRLHRGGSVQAVPIYLPEDSAIPAEAVPAVDGPRSFQADKRILQREARTDNVNLERAAYVLLVAVAAGWMVVISWCLRRIEAGGPPGPDQTAARQDRPAGRWRPAPV